MYIETEGIILKQVRTADNRRIVLIFSRNYGKISAGTNIPEKSKSKSSLALKPFTYGKYELFKGRDTYHVNGAEVIKSYYGIGENIEKFMCSSYILEFTEKVLSENVPMPSFFELLIDFLDVMERRSKKFLLMATAYQIKALHICGSGPVVDNCVICGRTDGISAFSISEGGLVCSDCMDNAKKSDEINDSLIYEVDFGIVNIIRYILNNPIASFEKLALDEKSLNRLRKIFTHYISYHLDVKELKSEEFLTD